MRIQFMFLLALMILLSACTRPIVVSKLTESSQISETGLFYALPRTLLIVKTEITTKKPGKYAQCRHLLDLTNYNSTHYEVGEIEIASLSKPDESEIYWIDLEGKWFENRSLTLSLTELGAITDMSATITDKRPEIVLKTFASVLTALPIALMAPPIAPPIDRTTVCTDERAKYQSEQIKKIKTKRTNILTRLIMDDIKLSEMKDLKLLLDMLEAEETRLMRDFSFSVISKYNVEFHVRPQQDKTTFLYPLFKFYPGAGLEPIPDDSVWHNIPTEIMADIEKELPFAIFYLEIAISQTEHPDKTLRATFEKIHNPNGKVKDTETKKRGFYYRIPATADIKIFSEAPTLPRKQDVHATAKVMLAQLGVVASLSPKASGSGQIKYHHDSGSIKTISTTETAFEPKWIDQGMAPIQSLLEKTFAKDDDELNRLQREAKILEYRKNIQDYKNALGLD